MRNFWNSLQFRIPTLFIVSFLLILAAIFGVFSTIGKELFERQAYRQVVLSGQNIVSELGRRIALAESLATSLANLGEKLPSHDDAGNRELLEHLINYEGTEAFIAGGGLWPEPYQYDPATERRSFFWGRDSEGELRYYDDYNNPEGPGYHHEEWYVPARYLGRGQAFWSKSYMDPYSYQPMVTVTVPMFRNDKFYGVSTIDLKLEGLRAFLEKSARSFGGYAFAVDRNGKFLSFPDEKLTKLYGKDAQGKRTDEFIDVRRLAQEQAGFKPLADVVQNAVEQVITRASNSGAYDKKLAESLAADSYQIDESEARLIASVLASGQSANGVAEVVHQQIFLEQDMLLGEAAFASVFEMPGTYWKIVTVMPYSSAIQATNLIYRNLVTSIVIVMLISLIIILLLVRKILVRPISKMSGQLKMLTESGSSGYSKLDVSDSGELGTLAFWFNERSKKLYEVQKELRKAHEEVEERVNERTDELRREIERRKSDQAVKEARAARVMSQHSAIVNLSIHESLFHGDVVEAARIVNEAAAEVVKVERCGIWLIDDSGTYLECIDLYESSLRAHEGGHALKIAEYPAYMGALNNDRSIAIYDVGEDARTGELSAYTSRHGIVSMLDSPIRVGGKLRGVVCFEQVDEQREWHRDEIRFCGEIADQFQQVLTNAERLDSEEKIRQLAFYDPLTELSNRRLLQEEIQHALEVARRQGLFGSIIYLDLDNFKMLNDSLGHSVGDELLRQLSDRLRAILRKEDTASRLGGDEFVVLLTGENPGRHEAMEQALRVAQKIQVVIGETYRLQGYEHIITSSMGITLYPENDETVTDLLKQADAAMYRAKEEGRNTIRFYSPEMQQAADNRLQLEKELRAAIRAGEFEIYYQPQVDVEGILCGCEALVRWNHPCRGLVTPAEFIPVAEETGLILELGRWILEGACRFVARSPVVHVAVNISPMQFRQKDFVECVSRILEHSGAEPGRLMFELTEGVLIENVEDTIGKMNALKEMGIRISIDDFGTGYSSLAYLRRLPLDQLKINNDFVREIGADSNHAIIVETIISMARHLGLDVVAEGVETRGQFAFLREKGCHIFQGYYYSTPLTGREFDRYMQEYATPGAGIAATAPGQYLSAGLNE